MKIRLTDRSSLLTDSLLFDIFPDFLYLYG